VVFLSYVKAGLKPKPHLRFRNRSESIKIWGPNVPIQKSLCFFDILRGGLHPPPHQPLDFFLFVRISKRSFVAIRSSLSGNHIFISKWSFCIVFSISVFSTACIIHPTW
jgi:hypothetical protein